jgi:hypothetical protein
MITWSILQSAFLYCGFLLILLWRLCFPWQLGKTWRKSFNHFTILYFLITVLYLAELVYYVATARRDLKATASILAPSNSTLDVAIAVAGQREWPIYWLRSLVLMVPVCVPVIIVMTGLQSKHHLEEIRQDSAQLQHDRVINIVALPAVYAVVTMSGLGRLYGMVVEVLEMNQSEISATAWEEKKASSFAEYETCIFVGDLYEAWALYQFGKLTVELLQNALPEERASDTTEASHLRNMPAGVSIEAMSSMMWLGTGLFIVVNLVQTGWALYLFVFQDPTTEWETFDMTLSKFSWAGMVASAAAIYNVHIIESTFGHFITGYAPFLKFLSVKILVFFAFWQGPVLFTLQIMGIIHLTDVQLKLLQASLIVFECLFCACLHVLAWGSQEQWYAGVGEKTPLFDRHSSKA